MTATTYYLETMGCQMNVLDSQLVEGQLRALGLTPTPDHRRADIILFNTCSVRQHAEDKVLSRLGQLKAHKRRRPRTIIGVLGCMAQREKEALFTKVPHLDLLCGPGELHQLPALLTEALERHQHIAAFTGPQSRRTSALQRSLDYDGLEALDLSRSLAPGDSQLQAYVRVQRGCDKFCTYCVVPFTRGPERSRPPAHIVEEVRRLADQGCREVTLLGQTVNSYACPEDGQPVTFARLLERVHAIEAIDRVRFVTSFPADWDEDIFRVMRDYPRIMPYLHIPAQSGSDRILKAMRRGYTVAEYLDLMDTARKYLPHIALAGDFIVGFCGETDQDFEATVDLVRRVEYKSIFVFKYSPRPGTAAERWSHPTPANSAVSGSSSHGPELPPEVKAARNHELLAVQEEISLRHKRGLLGQTVEVLVSGFSKSAQKGVSQRPAAGSRAGRSPRDAADTPPQRPTESFVPLPVIQDSEQSRGDEAWRPGPSSDTAPHSGPLPARHAGQLVGRTRGDLIVVFNADPATIGALAKVRITDASPLTLFGEVQSVTSAPRPMAWHRSS